MNVFQHRPTLRWSVPLVAAALLAAGGSAIGVITASARDGLPERSASQLLVDVQKARLDGLSGTIVQNADLGLPSLPGMGGGGSSDMRSLVSGSHTLRLWYAGPSRVRLSLLGSLGESDLVRSGTDVWMWSSSRKTAVHRSVPATSDTPSTLASMSPMTPQQAAEAALKAITPSTRVSTAGTAVVAGRSAYELLLQPRDTRSLVASVRVAIDGKTHIPTRVQVFATGTSKPAVEVGFTSFDPSPPAASVFRFNPPPGTKVTEGGAAEMLAGGAPAGRAPRSGPADGKSRAPRGGAAAGQPPTVVGTGWTSVVIMRVPPTPTGGGADSVAGMLRILPRTSGSWGSGRLLRGRLFSALLTDDGRLVAGAVAPDQLYAALAKR
jgi:outer membrane lipoprotein-sorting protein